MRVSVSNRIREKLVVKHKVRVEEIEQCFDNRDGGYLKDNREQHKTNPPTQWFIAETNIGRKLKIVFMRMSDGSVEIKTAYPPDQTEEKVYDAKAY